MKFHAQFLVKDLKSEIVDALGTDGVYILDGRNSLTKMISDSKNQMKRMRHMHPNYIGFAIKEGTRFDNSEEIFTKILRHI